VRAGIPKTRFNNTRYEVNNTFAFAALKSDGSVVTWGSSSGGGDSSGVSSRLSSGVVSFSDPFNDDRLVPTIPVSTITLTLSPSAVLEDSNQSLVYTFARSGVSTNKELTVNYTFGSTADSDDYTGVTPGSDKTITFNPGATTATLAVTPIADGAVEEDEFVILTLATGKGYNVGTEGGVIGTITNDDSPPTFVITATNSNQREGNTGSRTFTFTITRSGNTKGVNTLNWSVSGTGSYPAEPNDFTGGVLPTGTVNFAAREISKVITVNVQGDTIYEQDKTFTVTLANPNNSATLRSAAIANITNAKANGIIVNDDLPAITLALSPTNVIEDGVPNLVYTFTRNGTNTSPLTINYTIGGTATLGTDYTGIPLTGTTKTITFARGSSTATLVIDPTVDTTPEPDETVIVTLVAGTGYSIGTTTPVTGTITNDDITLAIAATTANQLEGNSGTKPFTFTITRAGTAGTTAVNWAVTGSGTNAADNADFSGSTLPSGTVNFAVGETSKTITVNVQGDTIPELDETFTVTLFYLSD